ncbi:kinase-like protein [Macrolepiota fuliginosa MF-IS2]|uniref:non-specific serine/threonine protein kinase n=1 Tax=Macrolepiota fuliginosa MF-IS2 TaxID=1400762 RepID=A0A9P5XHV2_9AGAR|nr:kinase-like protein [Macrolepiota fuliginosa MF-IS2]
MPRQVPTGGMPDFSGSIVDKGRYLLDKMLGSGAYGKVYRAVDLKSPADNPAFYAIKCMPTYDSKSTKAQFQQRELTNHPVVRDHPNIVRFERCFKEEDWIFVVMELVEGGDLFAAITEKHAFQNNDALVKKIYLQIIDALQHCHAKGIFHRDIKPENILCSEDGQHIKLADFGLSTMDAASTEYGCGSCYYMSPECIAERKPRLMYSSRQTDVWSMGVILVNLISGRNPWRYATNDDQCFSAYLRDNDFLGNVLPISAEANVIIKRIFNLDIFHRITLEELKEEILRVRTFFRSHQHLKPPAPQPEQPTEYVDSFMQTESDPFPSKPALSTSSEGGIHTSPLIEIEPPITLIEVPASHNRSIGPEAFISRSSSPSHDPSSATDSSKSSMVVKTPSVHPAGPVAVAPPGGGPDDDVGESLVLPGALSDKDIRSPGGKAKFITINRRNIFRAAVQRIKDLSVTNGNVVP